MEDVAVGGVRIERRVEIDEVNAGVGDVPAHHFKIVAVEQPVRHYRPQKSTAPIRAADDRDAGDWRLDHLDSRSSSC